MIEKKTEADIGFTVRGVSAYVHRTIRIDDVNYDADTTLTRINGNITDKTEPTAAVPVSVGSDIDFRYIVSSGEIEGVNQSRPV